MTCDITCRLARNLVVVYLLLAAGACRPAGDVARRRPAPDDSTSLTIKGSDTMVYLVMLWAEAFTQSQPHLEISVTGGGSGTGFAALLNGTTDLCATSRSMRPHERELATKAGIDPVEFLVARDGLAVVVHPSNPVPALSIEQLRRIYTGVYRNWREVGGEDRPILALSRDTSSGTYVFFEEHVLLKQDFRADARLLPATSAIVQATAKDAGAIGYVGLGFAVEAGESVKLVPIRRSAESAAIPPSREDVLSGEYSIARPLYLIASGPPRGVVREFIDFCLSPQGQAIVGRTGYVATR